MATTIKATDINNMNSTVSGYGSTSKLSSKLEGVNLDTATENNVSVGEKAVPINLENLKEAINILESNFSSNCCQSQCHSYSTVSSCQVCQTTTSTCQSCQACQSCQSTSCQSTSCQGYCYYQCSRCDCRCNYGDNM